MRRIFRQSWFRLVAFPFSLVIGVLAVAHYYRTWSIADARAVWAMSKECHPVWKDLQRGRITAGQDVEEVIRATNPLLVARFGNYTQLSFQDRHKPFCRGPALRIVAKDGKLVAAAAWGWGWDRVFFDCSASSAQSYLHAFEAHEQFNWVNDSTVAVLNMMASLGSGSRHGVYLHLGLLGQSL